MAAKPKPITITRAAPYDAVRIARMLDEWFKVSAIQWPPSDPSAMVQWVSHVIEHGYVVIAEKDERLFGVAGIQPVYLPWNLEQPILRDQFFYVPPAHRKLGVADALMSAMKIKAAKMQMPLMMAIISGVNTDKLDRWYGIKGGRYAGGVLVFGLPDKED